MLRVNSPINLLLITINNGINLSYAVVSMNVYFLCDIETNSLAICWDGFIRIVVFPRKRNSNRILRWLTEGIFIRTRVLR